MSENLNIIAITELHLDHALFFRAGETNTLLISALLFLAKFVFWPGQQIWRFLESSITRTHITINKKSPNSDPL
jgi:hypothetical protein